MVAKCWAHFNFFYLVWLDYLKISISKQYGHPTLMNHWAFPHEHMVTAILTQTAKQPHVEQFVFTSGCHFIVLTVLLRPRDRVQLPGPSEISPADAMKPVLLPFLLFRLEGPLPPQSERTSTWRPSDHRIPAHIPAQVFFFFLQLPFFTICHKFVTLALPFLSLLWNRRSTLFFVHQSLIAK